MKILMISLVVALLSQCTGVTRGTCSVHAATYCETDDIGMFTNGETWESCKKKPVFSKKTIATLDRSEKEDHAAYKTWIGEHCP